MRVAQLSDLHLLEAGFHRRSVASKTRARFLSMGRPLDPGLRRERFREALRHASVRGFDHLLLSGDLTEEGIEPQFDVVADVLHESGVALDKVTLIAGNHDLYHHGEAWTRALSGPFQRSALMSRYGEPIDTHGVTLIPVDTTRAQHYVLSAGVLDEERWQHVRTLVAERAKQKRTVVIFMHHPPRRHALSPLQWIDGLRNAHLVHSLLAEFPNVHVMHGHTHRAVADIWPGADVPRVFSAASVVESTAPLRVYEVSQHGVTLAAEEPEPAILAPA